MLMPQMGESITEATISKWVKKAGDFVNKDETILEITTDKVDSEIPAPASGILTEVLYAEGDVVPVKNKIAVIDSEGKAVIAPVDKNITVENNVAEPKKVEAEPLASKPVVIDVTEESGDSKFYSPLVKSLAAKHNLSTPELDSLRGSGTAGRVTKEDILDYVERKAKPQVAAPVVTPVSAPSTPVTPKPAVSAKADLPTNQWLPDGTKRVPMDGMRRAIADHMVRSKHTSPHVYTIQEADVSKISKWRAIHKDEFKKREGFGLSFTPFFLEAAVKALQEFPIVNASIDEKTIVYKKDVNLGCAVSIGNTGLIVPVIKKADERNLVGLARGLNDLALKARDKKLTPDEVSGGTFTVTNPGVFGTMIGTPIINQPQSAILCLGAIEKRPVVVDDMIAIRERCYITLSYDHRIIDGAISAQYLAFICNYLANWDMDRGLF